MIDSYTRLLKAVADTGETAVADVAVTKLVRHLKSMGRMKMLPQIVRELRTIAARRNALHPRLEVASAKEVPAALKDAKTLGIAVEQVEINPSLIRGWRAQSRGRLIDRSAKQALIQIYQKVTA